MTSRRPPGDAPLAADLLGEFVRMAGDDPSGLVRLTLASTLQRLPVASGPTLALALLRHPEDAGDHNLPLLIWYGLIPVADADPSGLARLAADCALPDTRRLIARRLAEDLDKRPGAGRRAPRSGRLDGRPALRADILAGLAEGVRGWRKAPRPAAWDAVRAGFASSTDRPPVDRVRDLGVLFGDGRALDEIRRLALDGKADLEARRRPCSP